VSLQFETARIEPDITVVRLVSSLIAGPEGHALEQLVRDLIGRGEQKLILDMCGVEKISDVGAQFLIQCFFTVRQSEGGMCCK
jgi:anti-anti-sigma regulatory factor